MLLKAIREFVKFEASAGILLMVSMVLALMVKNSGFASIYDGFLAMPLSIHFGELILDKSILLWINDGLMAVFFLLVGLEIKREIIEGHLSSRKLISLPAIAALGGVIVPAALYYLINIDNKEALHGWAVPSVTDIAFSLGIIQLLGKRAPEQLKITLLAIAIMDDLAAIVIIALFYGHGMYLTPLFAACGVLGVLAFLNYKNVTKIGVYILLGVVLWVCLLKSGIHATLAGVLLAMCIPLRVNDKNVKSSFRELERNIHPYVTYLILPLFAFANAGVSLGGLSFETMINPITVGIVAGLFLGKQCGVMLFTYLGDKLNLCELPRGIHWKQYYGMAILTGIGFTMSLFIGTLGFTDSEHQDYVRIGVMLGSLFSAVFGYMFLRVVSDNK